MKYCKYCMSEIDDNASVCPKCGKDLTSEDPVHHLRPGTLLAGKYVVGTALGEGGFGITYLGINKKLDLKVAIKEFFPFGYVHRVATASATVTERTEAADERFFEKGRDRFLAEAKTLAKFNNENGVVSVYDFFEENNTAYIVMEYLEGETLKAYLNRKGVLSYDETLSLLMPAMKSLSKVHEKGLIHRDISPDNIMLTEDKVKLLDFGAAREAEGNKSLSVMLKHGYAPEEQYRRKGEQGPWTDVYALSATIYKCITGTTPDDAAERMHKDELKPPSAFGAQIYPLCEAALMKGLAVDADNRYRSIGELITGLTGGDKSLLAAPKPVQNPAKAAAAAAAAPKPDADKTVFGTDPDRTVFTDDAGLGGVPDPVPVYPGDDTAAPVKPLNPAKPEKKSKKDKPEKQNKAGKPKKKKFLLIAIIAAAAVLIAAAVIVISRVAPTPNRYFEFIELDDGTYEIKALDVFDMPAHVVIPSQYNGKQVTRIADDAFYGSYGIKSEVIPYTVTSIGTFAFYDCANLTKVTFKDPDGWSAGYSDLSSDDLSDPEEAAYFLTDKYCFYEWLW